jgi:sRNA-binding carbon storage regulator CsrA
MFTLERLLGEAVLFTLPDGSECRVRLVRVVDENRVKLFCMAPKNVRISREARPTDWDRRPEPSLN